MDSLLILLGLNVHMNQVHKENLTAIENALPNRAGLDIEIFAMEGIPEDIVQQHNMRVLQAFHQAEAERRAATGNPAPGSAANTATKKPKFESPAELKKRLAEHKAAKLAAEQNGTSTGSGGNTPVSVSAQPILSQQTTQVASPAYPGYQQPYAPPPATTTHASPQSYNSPAAMVFPPAPYGVPPNGFIQSPPPQQPPYTQTPQPYQPPYIQPPQPPFQQPPFPAPGAFSPPAYQGQPPFPSAGFQTQVPQNGYPGQVGAPRTYTSASPVSQFPHQQQRTHSPAQNGQSTTQRAGSASLPSAPGLPQRPVVSAPSVNAAQFAQMHQGQIPTQHNFPPPQTQSPQQPPIQSQATREEYNPAAPQVGMPRGLSAEAQGASSLDDLISDASKQADVNAVRAKTATPKPATPQPTAVVAKEEAGEEKVTKKDKEGKEKTTKPTRMVYTDNETSPEEKMALMPKYAFTHPRKAVQA